MEPPDPPVMTPQKETLKTGGNLIPQTRHVKDS